MCNCDNCAALEYALKLSKESRARLQASVDLYRNINNRLQDSNDKLRIRVRHGSWWYRAWKWVQR